MHFCLVQTRLTRRRQRKETRTFFRRRDTCLSVEATTTMREKNWKYWYTELFTDHKYIYYFDGSIGTPRKKYNQMIDIKKYPNERNKAADFFFFLLCPICNIIKMIYKFARVGDIFVALNGMLFVGRRMCTRYIFDGCFFFWGKSRFSFFSFDSHFFSGVKIINKNFYPSRFRRVFFLSSFGGNVKMRLTFMVVFFTIYNAQSQRKRKFSCINQSGPEKGKKEKEKALELVFLRDGSEIYAQPICGRLTSMVRYQLDCYHFQFSGHQLKPINF